MLLAVYHNKTLELLGTLNSIEYPERFNGPMRDGKTFALPMLTPGPARYDADVSMHSTQAVLSKVLFIPVVLRNSEAQTFSLMVDCHPDDLKRVPGFKALQQ
jgi:hypothetical protein